MATLIERQNASGHQNSKQFWIKKTYLMNFSRLIRYPTNLAIALLMEMGKFIITVLVIGRSHNSTVIVLGVHLQRRRGKENNMGCSKFAKS